MAALERGMTYLHAIGKRLQSKGAFVTFVTVFAGILWAPGSLWMFGEHGGIFFGMFLVAIGILGAFVSAHLLWLMFAKPYIDSLRQRTGNPQEISTRDQS